MVWVVISGIVPTRTYYDAASNIIANVPPEGVLFLQNSPLDHFGPTGKKQYSFVFVSYSNGPKSCVWVAKLLLVFRLNCPTFEEEKDNVFAVLRMHPLA